MASCRNAVAGILGEAILINFDDWKAATITETNGVISAIALARHNQRLQVHQPREGI